MKTEGTSTHVGGSLWRALLRVCRVASVELPRVEGFPSVGRIFFLKFNASVPFLSSTVLPFSVPHLTIPINSHVVYMV